VGSGHFPSLEVPDQVNGMVLQFLRIKFLMALKADVVQENFNKLNKKYSNLMQRLADL
jgi:hypothetical protein